MSKKNITNPIPGKILPRVDKKTLNDKNIPNCSAIYNMPNDSPIKLNDFGFETLPDIRLTPPTSHVFLAKKPYTHIRICAVAFIGRCKKVKNKDFHLKYNVSLNAIGKYALNVYIIFDKKEKDGMHYDFYSFDVRFLKKSIILEDQKYVKLSDIDTVEVFLVNLDPKTSRGTITTVQPSTE